MFPHPRVFALSFVLNQHQQQDERLFEAEFDDSPERPVEMESDEMRPFEARTYELRPFERRGLKRSADHQPRQFFREQVAKPLPWEWDLRRLTAHPFPISASSLSPATTGACCAGQFDGTPARPHALTQ
jgi:hypothetical protein